MADILVAMAQHALRVEEQETVLRGTKAADHESNMSLASNAEAQTQTNKSERETILRGTKAANHESNLSLASIAEAQADKPEHETFLRETKAADRESDLSLASNAETQTNKPERSDKKKRSDEAKPQSVSAEGTGKWKEKAAEQDKPKPKRALVKLASLATKDKYYGPNSTRMQLEHIMLRIRRNINALRSASLVVSTTTEPIWTNKNAFILLNKTIEINNLMVNNEWNEKMMCILENFLKSARTSLGSDIPIGDIDVHSNTRVALFEVIGLLKKAHKELEIVVGGALSKGHLRELGDFDEVDSDDGVPIKKKPRLSDGGTKHTTKKGSKKKGKK
jgi:hypothetical protein